MPLLLKEAFPWGAKKVPGLHLEPGFGVVRVSLVCCVAVSCPCFFELQELLVCIKIKPDIGSSGSLALRGRRDGSPYSHSDSSLMSSTSSPEGRNSFLTLGLSVKAERLLAQAVQLGSAVREALYPLPVCSLLLSSPSASDSKGNYLPFVPHSLLIPLYVLPGLQQGNPLARSVKGLCESLAGGMGRVLCLLQ